MAQEKLHDFFFPIICVTRCLKGTAKSTTPSIDICTLIQQELHNLLITSPRSFFKCTARLSLNIDICSIIQQEPYNLFITFGTSRIKCSFIETRMSVDICTIFQEDLYNLVMTCRRSCCECSAIIATQVDICTIFQEELHSHLITYLTSCHKCSATYIILGININSLFKNQSLCNFKFPMPNGKV